MKNKLNKSDLSQFIGSGSFTKWSILSKSVLTEGAKFVADRAGAYWLFDKIDLSIMGSGENFVVCKISVEDTSANIKLEDGNGQTIMSEWIRYTDFPLADLELWAIHNGSGYTHMLPSEY